MTIKIESEIQADLIKQQQETENLLNRHISIPVKKSVPICKKNCRLVQDCDKSCKNENQ